MSDTPETDAEISRLAATYKGTAIDAVLIHFARRLERERDSLRIWKNQQMEVESQWNEQAVGKMIGVKIGHSIRANIEPKIRELIAERDALREENRKLKQAIEHVKLINGGDYQTMQLVREIINNRTQKP